MTLTEWFLSGASGITGITILVGIKKIGTWLWHQLPPIRAFDKERSEHHRLLDEEDKYTNYLRAIMNNEMYNVYIYKVIDHLIDMDIITKDYDIRIELEKRLGDSIEQLSREIIAQQVFHERKRQQIIQELVTRKENLYEEIEDEIKRGAKS